MQFDEMSLCPHVILEPFEKWATDFVGSIKPKLLNKMYMLVFIDFVTKWVEVKSIPCAIEMSIANVLFDNIFTRFVVPRELVTNHGSHFTLNMVKDIIEKYKIKH